MTVEMNEETERWSRGGERTSNRWRGGRRGGEVKDDRRRETIRGRRENEEEEEAMEMEGKWD